MPVVDASGCCEQEPLRRAGSSSRQRLSNQLLLEAFCGLVTHLLGAERASQDKRVATRIALFLMGELVAAVRANDSDCFRDLLSEGIEELGVKEVEELLLDWLYSFLTAEE